MEIIASATSSQTDFDFYLGKGNIRNKIENTTEWVRSGFNLYFLITFLLLCILIINNLSINYKKMALQNRLVENQAKRINTEYSLSE